MALACFALGCSDESSTPTITQGVWGWIVAGCDTEDCDSSRVEGATVAAAPIDATSGPGGSSITDENGMYQITLTPGKYRLSRPGVSVATTDVTIKTGLTQCTWISGPGGGNWECR